MELVGFGPLVGGRCLLFCQVGWSQVGNGLGQGRNKVKETFPRTAGKLRVSVAKRRETRRRHGGDDRFFGQPEGSLKSKKLQGSPHRVRLKLSTRCLQLPLGS